MIEEPPQHAGTKEINQLNLLNELHHLLLYNRSSILFALVIKNKNKTIVKPKNIDDI